MLALGLVGAALLFAAELATLSYRTIGIGGCDSRENPGVCTTMGADAHGYALWLLALLAIVLCLGAAVGRSRPAALGAIACGLIVLGLALLADLPDLGSTRGLETRYNDVEAHTGAAFWLELLGGLLLLAAGVVALRGPGEPGRSRGGVGPPREPRQRGRRSPPRAAEGATAQERAAARAAARRARGG